MSRSPTSTTAAPSAKYDVVAGSGLIGTLAPRIERVIGGALGALDAWREQNLTPTP